MKIRKVVIVPLICIMVLLAGITVFAAGDGSDTNFCKTCGAALSTYSTPAGSWTSTHFVETDYYDSNGNVIVQSCQVTHTVYQLSKVCPSGHGTMWSGSQHHENHTSSYCTDKVYYE